MKAASRVGIGRGRGSGRDRGRDRDQGRIGIGAGTEKPQNPPHERPTFARPTSTDADREPIAKASCPASTQPGASGGAKKVVADAGVRSVDRCRPPARSARCPESGEGHGGPDRPRITRERGAHVNRPSRRAARSVAPGGDSPWRVQLDHRRSAAASHPRDASQKAGAERDGRDPRSATHDSGGRQRRGARTAAAAHARPASVGVSSRPSRAGARPSRRPRRARDGSSAAGRRRGGCGRRGPASAVPRQVGRPASGRSRTRSRRGAAGRAVAAGRIHPNDSPVCQMPTSRPEASWRQSFAGRHLRSRRSGSTASARASVVPTTVRYTAGVKGSTRGRSTEAPATGQAEAVSTEVPTLPPRPRGRSRRSVPSMAGTRKRSGSRSPHPWSGPGGGTRARVRAACR